MPGVKCTGETNQVLS